MTNLKANVQFTCTETGLTPDEKLMAIQNECQQTLYTDDDYDEAKYGRGITIFDTGMGIEDAEERNNTSLDPLYLEDGIDVELLCRVRQLHQGIKVPSETELDNYDKLDDCLSINHSGRDKRKFAVMKVSRDGNGIRKVIWNEEGNFEERDNPDDKPDWLLEMERNEEKNNRAKKIEHKTKLLRGAIRDTRNEYKPLYDTVDRLKGYDIVKDRVSKLKKKADKSYAEYKYYSRAMDKVKELDAKAEHQHLEREADMLLHLFVTFQQKCPAEYVDSVLREDIKAKYKAEGFERTRYYLVRLINRAEDLVQAKSYEEEEEA